jgi:acyl-CoA synthetase (AMP-forming)/AMP-acid ligase II
LAFPVKDPFQREGVAAMIVKADQTLSEIEIRTVLLDRLVPFIVPRRIHSVDAIPWNTAGKPLRFVETERFS